MNQYRVLCYVGSFIVKYIVVLIFIWFCIKWAASGSWYFEVGAVGNESFYQTRAYFEDVVVPITLFVAAD